MIDNNIQLLSWLISVLIGFIYALAICLFKRITINKRKLFKIFCSILFICIFSIFSIYVYYIVNGGIIHYSFLVFWVCGSYLFHIVKSYVKRHEN